MDSNTPETDKERPQKRKKSFFIYCVTACAGLFILLFVYRAVYMYKKVNTVVHCQNFADTSINMTGTNTFWYWLYQKEPQGRCVKKEG